MILMAVFSAFVIAVLAWPYTNRSVILACGLGGILCILTYSYLGNPTLPASPFSAIGTAEKETYRKLLLEEYALSAKLAENKQDVETLIHLVALRIAQGRDGGKTADYLAQAKALAPTDKRILKLEHLLENTR